MSTAILPNHTVDGGQFYEVVGRICDVADKNLRRSEYFDQCFEIVGDFFSAKAGMLNVRTGPRTLERSIESSEGYFDAWKKELDSLILRVQTDDASFTQEYQNPLLGLPAYIIAAPVLSQNNKPFGAAGFVISCSDKEEAKVMLALLSQLLTLVVIGAPTEKTAKQRSAENSGKSLQSVVRAADYQDIHQLCFAIVNSLCSKLGCEQIAIGLVKGPDVKLIAVSGLSELPGGTPGMQAVRQAMATCLDRNQDSVVQEPGRILDQCESSTCKVHEFWHRLTGGSCVATLPLRIDGKCVAVIAIRRQPHNPILPDDIKRARVLAESFAPALPLVDRASRLVWRHCYEAFFAGLKKWYGWNGLGRKMIAAAIFVACMWVIFGKTNYQVIAPCKIVANSVTSVSSPDDGLIVDVLVEPGQSVQAGDVLLHFDRKELLTERNRVITQIASTRIEANSLLQKREPQEAFLLQSKLEVLKAEKHLIDQKLGRTEIRASHHGVVLPTEIDQRVGQYVKKGELLFEIASELNWHLEVKTPETQVRHLKLNQHGSFQSVARPDRIFECAVTSISPSSKVVDQKNVVLTQALMQSREQWMKLGMEGFVKIDTGLKPVWWVYLHPVIDFGRLRLWL